MSHITTIELLMKDKAALAKAAKECGAEVLGEGTAKMFRGATATGLQIKLKGWTYPIVITKDNQVKFDNYNGAWGDIKSLHALKKAYTVHAAIHKAARLGQKLVRRVEKNGFVRLELQ